MEFYFSTKKTTKKSKPKKSKKTIKKTTKKYSRRELNIYRPERGCTDQSHVKKYRLRSSPSYPANLCRGQTKLGKDGVYKSEKRGRSRVFRWYKLK